MTDSISIVDGQTSIKQNYASHDTTENAHNLVFKKNVKIWPKITRIKIGGEDVDILLPFDTYIEPFYNQEDIDTTESTGVFDSSDNTYKLYSDANGNYKTLVSKYISWQRDRVVDTVTITVKAEDVNGNPATNYDTYIYNGNEWIAIKNGFPLHLIDYNGVDLDANLDASLSGQYYNINKDGFIIFQNKLKFRVVRNTDDEVIIKRIILKLTWNPIVAPVFTNWPTMFGTWGVE